MGAADIASGYDLLEGLSRDGWLITILPAQFAQYPAGYLRFAARRDGDAYPLEVYGRTTADAAPRLVQLCREADGALH
jgi:hypothetical protein